MNIGIYSEPLETEAHRSGAKLAIPIASDDRSALDVATKLVAEAGLEAIAVMPLTRAAELYAGTPAYGKPFTASELRALLQG